MEAERYVDWLKMPLFFQPRMDANKREFYIDNIRVYSCSFAVAFITWLLNQLQHLPGRLRKTSHQTVVCEFLGIGTRNPRLLATCCCHRSLPWLKFATSII